MGAELSVDISEEDEKDVSEMSVQGSFAITFIS